MFHQPFYFDLIRKYVVLVGSYFSDLKIQRFDNNGNELALIDVPVMYAPKDKMLARVLQDPNIDRQTATQTLPFISFEIGEMMYDGLRKLNTTGKVSYKKDANNFYYQYNPVPYDIQFKVHIYAKQMEDGTKILEQILPFFTPDYTRSIQLIPEVNEIKDIPLVFVNLTYEDKYDGKFEDRRAIVWTLNFVLKGYFYGPVRAGGVIKFINVRFHIPEGEFNANSISVAPVSESFTVQPGLTANGQPTSNLALTIPYNQINVTDDYGFITIITDPTAN